PGALPVRADHEMNLEVRLNQPAYPYLVWIDARARVVPLYPWNNDALDVKDVGPPPPRRPTWMVISPSVLGNGWQFSPPGGMETVLLLARRTPLGANTRLDSLLAAPPPAKVRRPDEVLVLALDRGAGAATALAARNRGPEEEARATEAPLRDLLARLRDHF